MADLLELDGPVPDLDLSFSEAEESEDWDWEQELDNDYENGKFQPSLSCQRYDAVLSVIQNELWKRSMSKIVEFGCAGGKFLRILKPLDYTHEVIGVDIDGVVLELSCRWIQPLVADFLGYRNQKQMDMYLMQGSVTEKDDRVRDADAVVAIEMIEHLHADALEALPGTVFDFIKPKLAIFTTPNVEFNALFPDFEGPFRHPDHKFEWSRNEFRDWAEGIISEYPEYKVKFVGIGKGPPGTEDTYGCASQMAVFVQRSFENQARNGEFEPLDGIEPPRPRVSEMIEENLRHKAYEVIKKHEYHFRRDERSLEQKFLDQIHFHTRMIATLSEEWLEDRDLHLDLDTILNLDSIEILNLDQDTCLDWLQKAGYKIERNSDKFTLVLPPDNYPPDSESEPEDPDGESDDVNRPLARSDYEEEDWSANWDDAADDCDRL